VLSSNIPMPFSRSLCSCFIICSSSDKPIWPLINKNYTSEYVPRTYVWKFYLTSQPDAYLHFIGRQISDFKRRRTCRVKDPSQIRGQKDMILASYG
jgi:hypothetical protein